MEKEYTYGNQTYTIKGSEDLHSFVTTLIGDVESATKGQKTLQESLSVWEKAKPIYTAKKLEINYETPLLEVMINCLADKYDVKGQSPETIEFMFHNVLGEAAPGKEDDKSNNDNKPENKQGLDKTNVVDIQTKKGGITSIELSGEIAKQRMSKSEAK